MAPSVFRLLNVRVQLLTDRSCAYGEMTLRNFTGCLSFCGRATCRRHDRTAAHSHVEKGSRWLDSLLGCLLACLLAVTGPPWMNSNLARFFSSTSASWGERGNEGERAAELSKRNPTTERGYSSQAITRAGSYVTDRFSFSLAASSIPHSLSLSLTRSDGRTREGDSMRWPQQQKIPELASLIPSRNPKPNERDTG